MRDRVTGMQLYVCDRWSRKRRAFAPHNRRLTAAAPYRMHRRGAGVADPEERRPSDAVEPRRRSDDAPNAAAHSLRSAGFAAPRLAARLMPPGVRAVLVATVAANPLAFAVALPFWVTALMAPE